MPDTPNPILQAAKRAPAQAILGGSDLLNLLLGAVVGNGFKGVTPKYPSETINQDIFGLAPPSDWQQSAAELAVGLFSPTQLLRSISMASHPLIAMMNTAAKEQKVINKEAGFLQ